MKVSDIKENEYAPFYGPYIKVLGDVELIKCLKISKIELEDFVKQIPNDKLYKAYAEGKWALDEVLLHFPEPKRDI